MSYNELTTRREEIEAVMTSLVAQATQAASQGDADAIGVIADTYATYKDKLAVINKKLGQ